MKKVLALLMVAGMFSLVACGPSEEEKAINDWVQNNINDPDTYESIILEEPNEDGYRYHKFRASNSLGAKVVDDYYIYIENGKVVNVVKAENYRTEKEKAKVIEDANALVDEIMKELDEEVEMSIDDSITK